MIHSAFGKKAVSKEVIEMKWFLRCQRLPDRFPTNRDRLGQVLTNQLSPCRSSVTIKSQGMKKGKTILLKISEYR